MRNNRKAYKKMWDEFAEKKAQGYSYDKFTPHHAVGLKNYIREIIMLEQLALRQNNIVLDVGCASGRQTLNIAQKVDRAIGVDISHTFVLRAKQEALRQDISNVDFQVTDIESLPFTDGSFDRILCAEVIEHIYLLRRRSPLLKRKDLLIFPFRRG